MDKTKELEEVRNLEANKGLREIREFFTKVYRTSICFSPFSEMNTARVAKIQEANDQ